MKNVTVIMDSYGDIVAVGSNDWEVKDYAFDKACAEFDDYSWSDVLSALDYHSTEDLRADTVARGFNDLWDYLDWEVKEGYLIGEGD